MEAIVLRAINENLGADGGKGRQSVNHIHICCSNQRARERLLFFLRFFSASFLYPFLTVVQTNATLHSFISDPGL